MLAESELVQDGVQDGGAQVVHGDEAAHAPGDLPAERLGDVPDCLLGTPAQRPAAAHRGAVPQAGEEHPGEPVPDLGHAGATDAPACSVEMVCRGALGAALRPQGEIIEPPAPRRHVRADVADLQDPAA
ncbi:MAG TPA: hypothetical protein VMV92_35485 [Streptosporangiaceae bacterium]|nr:hypothetical protein [Streptosporangiaceae bacterium]